MVSTGNATCKLGMFSVISEFLTKYHHDTCNTFVSLIVNINVFGSKFMRFGYFIRLVNCTENGGQVDSEEGR